MTRRLRVASMGLGALMLPACIGTRESAEVPPSQRIMTGHVVMDRSGVAPPGSRYARPGSASAPASLSSASNYLATAAAPPKPDVVKVVEPKLPEPLLDMPTPPPVVAVKHEKLIVAPPTPKTEIENLVLPPIGEQPAPASPIAPPVAAPAASAEPVRRPDWPVLGPRAEPKSGADSPAKSSGPAPMVIIPQPDPDARPDASMSMKIDALPDSAPAATLAAADTLLLQAIRAFQANRPQEALERVKHLDSANQELLMSLMPLMVRLCEGSGGTLPPDEVALVVDRLQSASGALKSKAALRLDRLCFCQGVRKFADIDPYADKHEFHSGDMVFLYAELKNFTCEPAAAQGQQPGYNAPTRGCNIRLASTLELRDSRQNLIWRTDLTKNDTSLTPPQDYYHTYRFCIPEKLPGGAYTLWLNVTDKPTGKSVRKSVEMRVAMN